MKRMFLKNMGYMLAAVLVPLILLLVANVAAPDAEVAVTAVYSPWYEVHRDMITVRLPVDGDVAEWIFGVSDGELLELITHEVDQDMYVASFRNFSDRSGEVELTLHGLNEAGEAVEIRSLKLEVGEGKLEVM